jgi:DNA-binding CsgD family transcriptional regulator
MADDTGLAVDDPPDGGSPLRHRVLAALLFGIALLAVADIAADVAQGTTWRHVAVEALIALGGVAGLVFVLGQLAGLGRAIDRQLVRWGLSPAETAIALLLLKGLSLKQIAAMRDVSEATVRQQARGIYRKAGVEGRHDLAAFFLEGLLLPSAEPPSPRASEAPPDAPSQEI